MMMETSCISPQETALWTPGSEPRAVLDREIATPNRSATPAVIHSCANVYKRPPKATGEQARTGAGRKLELANQNSDASSSFSSNSSSKSGHGGSPPKEGDNGGKNKGHQLLNGLKDFLYHQNHKSEEVDLEAQKPSIVGRSRSNSDASTKNEAIRAATYRFGRLSFSRKRHSGAETSGTRGDQRRPSGDDKSSSSITTESGDPSALDELDFEEDDEELVDESRDKPRPLYVDTRLANSLAETDEDFLSGSYPFVGRRLVKPQLRSRSNSGGENLLVFRNTSQPKYLEVLGKLDNQEEVYQQFLRIQSCYCLVPRLAKVVALDMKLTVRRAFLILRSNNVRAAPIWNSAEMCFCGMVTQTDFLEMLSYSNLVAKTSTSGEVSEDAGVQNTEMQNGQLTLEAWFSKKRKLLSASCDTGLLKVTKMFKENHIHRVPVFTEDGENALCLISLRAILQLIHRNLYCLPMPSWMKLLVGERFMGSWTPNLITITEEDKISSAINLMLSYKVSCLPVVDGNSKKLQNVLCKAKILDLLAKKMQDLGTVTSQEQKEKDAKIATTSAESVLNATVKEALEVSGGKCERDLKDLAVCQESDNLVTVMDKLATRMGRCVFVLDQQGVPIGAISVSDLMGGLIR